MDRSLKGLSAMHFEIDTWADVVVTCIWIVAAGAIYRLIFLAWDELTGQRK